MISCFILIFIMMIAYQFIIKKNSSIIKENSKLVNKTVGKLTNLTRKCRKPYQTATIGSLDRIF